MSSWVYMHEYQFSATLRCSSKRSVWHHKPAIQVPSNNPAVQVASHKPAGHIPRRNVSSTCLNVYTRNKSTRAYGATIFFAPNQSFLRAKTSVSGFKTRNFQMKPTANGLKRTLGTKSTVNGIIKAFMLHKFDFCSGHVEHERVCLFSRTRVHLKKSSSS